MAKLPLFKNQDDDGNLQSAIGPGAGLAFAEEYFPQAGSWLWIASAYFSLKGYEIGSPFISRETKVRILVGVSEKRYVKRAILSEIREELQELNASEIYDAVKDLVDRLRNGDFRIEEARGVEPKYHTKFYLTQNYVWHGSANYSNNGLKNQAEQVEVSHDPDQLRKWKRWFEIASENAVDISEEVAELLETWLAFSEPFEVYLFFLRELLQSADPKRDRRAHTPTMYQRLIASWTYHTLASNGGALLVIATGLGKTVICAEAAALLRMDRDPLSALVIAPKAVHDSWDDQLNGRGVSAHYYDYRLLFRSESDEDHHQITRLIDRLDLANENTIVIIDEAHEFRNQYFARQKEEPSHALDRIEAARKRGAAILADTGSAFSTNDQNLISQLALIEDLDQRKDELDEEEDDPEIKLFRSSPNVLRFGYAHLLKMARELGNVEGDAPYVLFGDERQYIPINVYPRTINYVPDAFDKVDDAVRKNLFAMHEKIYQQKYEGMDKDPSGSRVDALELTALDAWLSSPRAFLDAIRRNENTPSAREQKAVRDLFDPEEDVTSSRQDDAYNTSLKVNARERAALLAPIRDRMLEVEGTKRDTKASKLLEVIADIRKHREGSRKVPVFVELKATARYLFDFLARYLPDTNIITTVRDNGDLLSPGQRSTILNQFSPDSRDATVDTEYDVLICTDADGVGVNLHDCDVVINYDLSPVIARLIQRLGRVLRLTPYLDRKIEVITFIAVPPDDADIESGAGRYLKSRIERLEERHARAENILFNPALALDDEGPASYEDRAVSIEDLMSVEDVSADASYHNAAGHLMTLSKHKERAADLKAPIHSARYHDGDDVQVVILLEHNGTLVPIAGTPYGRNQTRNVRELSVPEALDLVRCEEDTPRVHPTDVLNVLNTMVDSERVAKKFCKEKGIDLDNARKRAFLYLVPRRDTTDAE